MCTGVELMKERFAKLLLGGDMSGGGKGVCTALAISNAITNLAGGEVVVALSKSPPRGLSEDARKRFQQCRDCINQILKAAMAINTSVIAEMEISNVYLESLPKVAILLMLRIHVGRCMSLFRR
ncbi:rop guanine nucleotide exchange factor 1-like isoform X3 [Chenopodium quinoa]|uniref:rop guanine nucleotide exchange factor 1-like isoform X3 n=1 Tax=Chenopodium quinoa TaxID=63459 RepID=UPI000B784BF9|nr:rop guanine nucleotide exchange factor 1-like isoform X3 [Chenopodium quinoa]